MGRLLHGLRALLNRRAFEQDLDDELRSYVDSAVERNVAAGMSPDEARRAARVAMGSIEATKDAVRDVGWESHLESIAQDIRHGRGRLVAAQVGLSLALLIAAALFIRSFDRIAALPLGFESERVLVVDVNTSRAALDVTNRGVFLERLTEAARTIPGVTDAGVSLNTPVNRGVTLVADFNAVGGAELPHAERRAVVNLVTPGWFETYGIVLRSDPVSFTAAAALLVAVALIACYLPARRAATIDPMNALRCE